MGVSRDWHPARDCTIFCCERLDRACMYSLSLYLLMLSPATWAGFHSPNMCDATSFLLSKTSSFRRAGWDHVDIQDLAHRLLGIVPLACYCWRTLPTTGIRVRRR